MQETHDHQKKEKAKSRRTFLKYTVTGGIATSLATYSPKSDAFVFVTMAKVVGELWGMAAKIPIDTGWDLVRDVWKSIQQSATKRTESAFVEGKTMLLDNAQQNDEKQLFEATKLAPNYCGKSEATQNILAEKERKRIIQEQLKQSSWKRANPSHKHVEIDKGMAAIAKSFSRESILTEDEKQQIILLLSSASRTDGKQVSYHHERNFNYAATDAREIMARAGLDRTASILISDERQLMQQDIKLTYENTAWRDEVADRANETGLTSELVRLTANETQLINQQLLSQEHQLITKSLFLIELIAQIKTQKD